MLATRLDYYHVLADDLSGEVFANIFSNSIKYTEGDTVHIWIGISQEIERNGAAQNRNPKSIFGKPMKRASKWEKERHRAMVRALRFARLQLRTQGWAYRMS